jgi:CBS domain-containing protein
VLVLVPPVLESRGTTDRSLPLLPPRCRSDKCPRPVWQYKPLVSEKALSGLYCADCSRGPTLSLARTDSRSGGAALVVRGGELAGIFTERDVLIKVPGSRSIWSVRQLVNS